LAATVAIDRRQLPDGGLTPMRVDPDTFEDLYAASADPWKFGTSPYEQRKYSITIASLPRNDGTGCVMSRRRFEPGCSVGALTARLAGVAEFVVARDASTSAIAQAARRLEPLTHIDICVGVIPEAWPDGVSTSSCAPRSATTGTSPPWPTSPIVCLASSSRW
jgi:hypothetical protein